jgi:hypothetical protein
VLRFDLRCGVHNAELRDDFALDWSDGRTLMVNFVQTERSFSGRLPLRLG